MLLLAYLYDFQLDIQVLQSYLFDDLTYDAYICIYLLIFAFTISFKEQGFPI